VFAVPVAACSAAEGSPAAAVGDPAEFLDVHVDQLARFLALVTDRGRLGRAQQLTGHRIQQRQPRHAVTGQDPRHRPRRHPAPGGDLVPPDAGFGADAQHCSFTLRRGP
jgi:hypothetical protein